MRKEDRIANQQQGRETREGETQPQRRPSEAERTRGSASTEHPSRPPRPSGRLPLPD